MLGAGIDRARAYVTNSVKQFKFVVIEGGRRRAQRELIADLKAVATYLRRPKAKVAGSQ